MTGSDPRIGGAPDPPGRGRAPLLLAVAALLAAAVLPYLPLLSLPFLSDDYHAVAKASEGARAVRRDLLGPQFGAATIRFWRPGVTASLAVDEALFGLDPAGYRATNLAFHATAILLLFALGRSLGLGRFASSVASLLFAAFPYGPGAVVWVVGRVDSQAAPFFLGSLLLHERAAAKGRRSWGSAACVALALSTKEVAASLPACLFALEWIRRGGLVRSLRRTAVPFALLAAYLVLRRLALGVWIGGYPTDPTGSPLLEASAEIGGAVSRVLAPRWLPGGTGTLVGWIVVAALALACRRGAATASCARVGLALWFLAALPAFDVLRRPDDLPNLRVLYVPAAGLCLAIAATCSRPRVARLAPALFVASMGIGLSRSLADHRAAGRDVARALDAVRRGEEVCGEAGVLFVEGVTRVRGAAYTFNWGFGSATAPPFRSGGPLVRMVRECLPEAALPGEFEAPAGHCLVRILPGGDLEVFPARDGASWNVSCPAFGPAIDRPTLQAAWDGADFSLALDPAPDGTVVVTLFTSLGANWTLLDERPRRLLRDVLSRPFVPGASLTLTHTIVQAFDAGDREFLLQFRSQSRASDLLPFRVGEDVVEAFRGFHAPP